LQKGDKMETQLIIRIEPGLKNKISRLAKNEGKNVSELVRELLVNYSKERDMGSYIDGLWENIGQSLSQNNVKNVDIDNAIKQVRAGNA
jgi:predicted DNA-binding protein